LHHLLTTQVAFQEFRRESERAAGRFPVSLWRLHLMSQHLPVVPDDGFDDASSDDRLIQGTVVRCVDGVWSTGDGTKLTPDMQWIALGTAEAIQRWKNNKPVETIKKTPDHPLPDVEELNAKIPQSEWEMGL